MFIKFARVTLPVFQDQYASAMAIFSAACAIPSTESVTGIVPGSPRNHHYQQCVTAMADVLMAPAATPRAAIAEPLPSLK